MKAERVTATLGVPTVWMGFQQHVASLALRPREDLCVERVLIGGAAAPRAVVETFATQFGTRVLHAWGMTETSPLVTLGIPLRKHQGATPEQCIALQAKQGRVPYGAQIKLADMDRNALPHDGQTAGHLLVRGHWVASGYFRGEGGAIVDDENWFDTGDIATIDADGYMQITDRATDLIKSGGEWISSIALENAAIDHPSVAEAAVIAVADEKWQERPLMLVVRRPGLDVSKAELLEFLSGRVARWCLPDDILFVSEMPHTATGKLQKMKLRAMYGGHKPADC
jgi:fatty-acyl-CoA synthase